MPHHYALKVYLDLTNTFLSVAGNIKYSHSGEPCRDICFYLHQDFEMLTLSGEDVDSYNFDKNGSPLSFLVHSRPVHIHLKRVIQPGEKVLFNFEYEGCLHFDQNQVIGRIGMDYTELAIYAPWFLLTPTMDRGTFQVDVRTKPYGIPLVGGEGISESNEGWRIEQSSPALDCCLILSPFFEKHCITSESNGICVQTVYVDEKDAGNANYLAGVSKEISDCLTALFGPSPVKSQTIALLPRTVGGGYNRRGLVVLNRFEEESNLHVKYSKGKEGHFKYLAHELAHLWWGKASVISWEDWLNESLAEYASMLVCRSAFGDWWIDEKIKKYESSMAELPPIWNIDRHHEKAFDTLYIKGPVLLHRWSEAVGEDAFIGFLRAFLLSEETTTRIFLALAVQCFGVSMGEKIKQDLMT